MIVDLDDKTCSCCGGTLHQIGEIVTKILDMVSAIFRVDVIGRPSMPAMPASRRSSRLRHHHARSIAAGDRGTRRARAGWQVDHLPLYRQAQIFERQGIKPNRSALGDWVCRACWWLWPVYDAIIAQTKIFAGDTMSPVLNPGAARPNAADCGATRSMTDYGVDQLPRPLA